MAKAAQASIYEVLTIDKDGKEVNIQGKTTSFSYYESVLSPNITASLTFMDTGGSIAYDSNYDKQERLGSIYNALPITSGEKVKFRIRNSNLGTLDFERNPLIINSASNLSQTSQQNAVLINLISQSSLTNQNSTVYKKYNGNIGNTVGNIIKEYLGTEQSKVRIDDTSNDYSFTGNSYSPFELIMWLAAKSVPSEGNAGFFFYETRTGFNFRSIDSLISQQPIATYYRSDAFAANIDNNINDFKIISFSISKNQNFLNTLKTGVLNSRNIYFNPKTFEEIEEPFQFTELIKSLGKDAEEPEVDTDISSGKFTRTHFDILDIGTHSPEIDGSDNNDPTLWQAQSTMRYNILFSQVVNIQVPCNINLRAGDTINCNFEIVTQSSKEQGSDDPVQSGKYLIIDLCHHFNPTKSMTSMTLVRDSYGLYSKNS
tara:strand:- start:2173 stop:3459 length:1287 start_codon:yes stop_codon:yes gene_type:complete